MNTHFSSICPRVYGLDGYNHIDRKYTRIDALNADAENVIPSKSQPIYQNSNPMSESSSSDKDRVTCALQPSWRIYVMLWCEEDQSPHTPRYRKSDIVDT